MKVSIYVAQPSADFPGMYEVAKFCADKENYIPIKGEIYPTMEEAQKRARELNEDLKKDNLELENR